MGPQNSAIANTLSRKFQALHEAFIDLADDATQFQNTLPVNDPANRGLFNSLSRIVAFSDHIHVAMNLMGEDVRAIDATYGEFTGAEWTELDECFDEWFAKMSPANAKVH